MRYHERFDNATDSVRAQMLHEIDSELNMLERECEPVQDPPEMHGRRRTYGQGGSRRQTAAEIVERALQLNDRQTLTNRVQQPSPASEIVDLTSFPTMPQRPRQSLGPVVMTFSSSGAIVRQSNPRTNQTLVSALQTRTQAITGISTSQERELVLDIILLESWTTEDMHSEAQAQRNALGNASMPSSYSQINLPSQPSHSRPHRQVKRPLLYQGELVQPRKRVKRKN